MPHHRATQSLAEPRQSHQELHKAHPPVHTRATQSAERTRATQRSPEPRRATHRATRSHPEIFCAAKRTESFRPHRLGQCPSEEHPHRLHTATQSLTEAHRASQTFRCKPHHTRITHAAHTVHRLRTLLTALSYPAHSRASQSTPAQPPRNRRASHRLPEPAHAP